MPLVELHRVIELLPEATVLVDARGEVVHFNRAAIDLVGVSGPGPASWLLLADDRRPLTNDPVVDALRVGEPSTTRAWLQRPRGVTTLVSVRVTPLSTMGATGAWVTFTPEPERHTAAELDEYRRYFELSDDLFGLASRKAKILRVNEGATRVLGWPADHFLGDQASSLMHPDDLQRAIDAITSNQVQRDVIVRMRHRDGTWRLISWTVYPERSEQFGDIVLLRGVEVTEKLRQQDQLVTSREQLAVAQDIARIGTIIRDLVAGNTEASPQLARMLEVPPGEELIPSALARMSPVDRERTERALSEDRHGLASTITVQIRLSEGPRDFRIWARPQADGTGRVHHSIAVVQDVTDETRLSAQLRTAERAVAMGTLAAGVAHEINNPLAFILGNLQAVKNELGRAGAVPGLDMVDLLAALSEAIGGAERVRDIVAGLRAFTSTDDRTTTQVELPRVLDAALNLTRNETRTRARVVTSLDAVPTVKANEARLGQLFLNLVLNAAQAIRPGDPEHNELAVRCRLEGHSVVVEVSDTGEGIPPENRSRIFDPFFTTREPGVGTGLGLFVAQGTVRELGGTIRVAPNVTRGTTFTVTLPVGDEAHEPAPAPVASAGQRVLVVDDEPMILRTVKRMLKGHTLSTASSGEEALSLLRREQFDVILCDMMMPGLSGAQLYEQLDPALRSRMVFMTGGSASSETQAFLDRHAPKVVDKPFDAGDLERAVSGFTR